MRHSDHHPGDLAGQVALLFHQIGHGDAMRPPCLDPGLDGRPDRVGVHVHVPQTAAADHDQGVAHRVQSRTQVRDAVVLGVEQIHHLVARTLVVSGGHGFVGDDRLVTGDVVDVRFTGQDLDQRIEDDHQPLSARVHNSSRSQGRQLSRGPGEGVVGVLCGGPRHRCDPGRSMLGGAIGSRPGNSEDGALDRPAHRRISEVGGSGQGLGECAPGGLVHLPDHIGHAAQQLTEDDSGVAAGAEQSATGQRIGRGTRGAGRIRHLDRRDRRRLDRQVHVRPGVTVGDREHVEGVDLGTAMPERILAGTHPRTQGSGIEGHLGHLGHGRPLLTPAARPLRVTGRRRHFRHHRLSW